MSPACDSSACSRPDEGRGPRTPCLYLSDDFAFEYDEADNESLFFLCSRLKAGLAPVWFATALSPGFFPYAVDLLFWFLVRNVVVRSCLECSILNGIVSNIPCRTCEC